MRQEPKIFGVIMEYKLEGPLIMEGKPMTESDARNRMMHLNAQPNVIRVAMFSMKLSDGNETLIEKEIL